MRSHWTSSRESAGSCNVFDGPHVEPGGAVKPCCGIGPIAPGLTMGNVRHESLPAIAERIHGDLLLNCFRTRRGPAQLFKDAAGVGLNRPQNGIRWHLSGMLRNLQCRENVIAALRQNMSKGAVEYLAARRYANRNVAAAECSY